MHSIETTFKLCDPLVPLNYHRNERVKFYMAKDCLREIRIFLQMIAKQRLLLNLLIVYRRHDPNTMTP